MIVLVAASIYLPGLFAPPAKFNFVYVTGEDYYGRSQYVVEQGRLAKRTGYTPGAARLFVHDVATNRSQEMTFEEAQRLSLNPSAKSPDGFEVVHGSHEDSVFPIFFGHDRDDNALYLKGHHASQKLNVEMPADQRYYYRGTRFLGWIQEAQR
jgi:hypothetical protein